MINSIFFSLIILVTFISYKKIKRKKRKLHALNSSTTQLDEVVRVFSDWC